MAAGDYQMMKRGEDQRIIGPTVGPTHNYDVKSDGKGKMKFSKKRRHGGSQGAIGQKHRGRRTY